MSDEFSEHGTKRYAGCGVLREAALWAGARAMPGSGARTLRGGAGSFNLSFPGCSAAVRHATGLSAALCSF